MSNMSEMFRQAAGKIDLERDMGLSQPENITALRNIPYIPTEQVFQSYDVYNMLDVYYPLGTKVQLPVIVSIHGGGFVYGTKEVYQYYGMFLAQQGFTVINFNYHLAPEHKFPTQLQEINSVLCWMQENAEEYHIDINNVFLVGDSAGAQLASHYCAIYSNPVFAAKFPFVLPTGVTLRAAAFNCGTYTILGGYFSPENAGPTAVGLNTNELTVDYLGEDANKYREMCDVLGAITREYPPVYIMSSKYDFLLPEAKPMYEMLQKCGVESVYKIYGEEGQEYMGHVFHVNMHLDEAKACNMDECEFFKQHFTSI